MATRERAADRGARLARQDLTAVGGDIRTARLTNGLTLREVGRAVGVSYSTAGRVERAAHPNVSAARLARIGAVVGLDIRIRAYPGPDPIREAGQAALLGRFRTRLHVRLSIMTEVPLPIEGDQRAWDAVIARLEGRDSRLPVEVETRIYDAQAQFRRINLKCRDGGFEHVLVVIADTHRNREAVRALGDTVSELFPVPARAALAALGAGRHPGGSALVFL